MNYGFFPDKASFFEDVENVIEKPERTPQWRPQEKPTRLLVLGPPRSEKVVGQDGKERLKATLLVEAGGELATWTFSVSVFHQLKDIETDHGLDNVWIEVRRRADHRGFPRIEVVVSEHREA
jgi:hypothetical protein